MLKSGHRTGLEVRAPRALPTDGSNLLAPLRLRPHYSDSASSERDQITPPHLRVWYGVCFGSLWPVYFILPEGWLPRWIRKKHLPLFLGRWAERQAQPEAGQEWFGEMIVHLSPL